MVSCHVGALVCTNHNTIVDQFCNVQQNVQQNYLWSRRQFDRDLYLLTNHQHHKNVQRSTERKSTKILLPQLFNLKEHEGCVLV